MSNLNYFNYYLIANSYFTFSYKKNYVKDLLSFRYSLDCNVKTTLYDKNKKIIKVIDKLYVGFSFKKYFDIDKFFIKVEFINCTNCNINILTNDYPNLFYLSQKDNTIKFNTTLYSSYIFYIDITKAPENKINFKSKLSSLDSDYIFYYYSDLNDTEELKSELYYKFENVDILDGKIFISNNEQFIIPLNKNKKKLVFIMYPKINKTDYYIKALFYSSEEIETNINYKIDLNEGERYQIFNYKQKQYINNNIDGFIYFMLNDVNADKHCSLFVYDDTNDTHLENIKYNSGNFKEKKWKTFNYTSGDMYFIILNFYYSLNREYSFMIKNNKEYYDITNNITNNSEYSLSMQFNNTKSQYVTFSICPDYEYYLYFNITPTDLNADISALKFDNNSITPIDNKYYLVNKNDITFFKISLSSSKVFSNFIINIKKIDNILTKDNDNNHYLIIGIIILGVLHILMFIIYIIRLKCKSKKDVLVNQIESINL